jgi:hypothetical protein
MTPPLRDRQGPQALPLLLAVVLPLLAAMLVGGDSSWDLRNYHLYNPHALLSGRGAIDVAPAQVQTWHNPLLDLPMYWLATSGLPARVATLWLAAPMMLSLWCLLRLQALMSVTPPTRLAQVVLALLAFTGAAAWSTFALSTNDGFVAAGMLSALCLALDNPQGRPAVGWGLAGLIAGATSGLKLSAMIYCVALAAAALPGGQVGDKARRLVWLALGGLAGFALTYGWWGWRMTAEFGNPVFPYFNQWFHSAAASPNAFADERFLPGSVVAELLAPIRLLRNSRLFSELTMRDPRLLCGLLAFALLAWGRREPAARHAPGEARAPTRGTSVGHRAIACFVIVGFAVWARQYGIYRYAIVLEMLGALGLVLVLQRLPGRWLGPLSLLSALVLVSADTRRPDWGRDAAGPIAHMRAPPLGRDAIVVTAADAPLSYLALGLPANVPMLGLAGNFIQPGACTRMQARAMDVLATPRAAVWLLSDGPPKPDSLSLLQKYYGLAPGGTCIEYSNPLAPASLCSLRRTRPVHGACPAQAR